MAGTPLIPNDGAIIRLVGTLALETSDEWAVARRDMSLETLARVSEKQDVSLPALGTCSKPDLSEGRPSYTTT